MHWSQPYPPPRHDVICADFLTIRALPGAKARESFSLSTEQGSYRDSGPVTSQAATGLTFCWLANASTAVSRDRLASRRAMLSVPIELLCSTRSGRCNKKICCGLRVWADHLVLELFGLDIAFARSVIGRPIFSSLTKLFSGMRQR
jgi:hypothetical protein